MNTRTWLGIAVGLTVCAQASAATYYYVVGPRHVLRYRHLASDPYARNHRNIETQYGYRTHRINADYNSQMNLATFNYQNALDQAYGNYNNDINQMSQGDAQAYLDDALYNASDNLDYSTAQAEQARESRIRDAQYWRENSFMTDCHYGVFDSFRPSVSQYMIVDPYEPAPVFECDYARRTYAINSVTYRRPYSGYRLPAWRQCRVDHRYLQPQLVAMHRVERPRFERVENHQAALRFAPHRVRIQRAIQIHHAPIKFVAGRAHPTVPHRTPTHPRPNSPRTPDRRLLTPPKQIFHGAPPVKRILPHTPTHHQAPSIHPPLNRPPAIRLNLHNDNRPTRVIHQSPIMRPPHIVRQPPHVIHQPPVMRPPHIDSRPTRVIHQSPIMRPPGIVRQPPHVNHKPPVMRLPHPERHAPIVNRRVVQPPHREVHQAPPRRQGPQPKHGGPPLRKKKDGGH